MFIDIDLEKRSKEYKIELAKPNKQIITNLYEKSGSKLNLKLGGLNELNFSIPYYVENEEKDGMIENKNIKRIKELMYLRLTWGEYQEWFVIDNISDESDETEIMNIQAFSIGYELKRKNVEGGYQKTAINAREFFGDILQGTSWKIGVIDNSFEGLYRSFDEGETDRFSLIQTAGETFGGIIEWDNKNKKINLKELDNIGEYKGFSINYDRLMSGLSKKRTTDDIVTRLYVYGNEGLTIENVNPTNNRYIEDYSYFLYPFKRDSQKNVLEHSDYMSDDLCHAILDNQELKARYEPQIKTLQTTIDTKNKQLSTEMIKLDDLNFSLASAKGLLDIAKAVDDKALITQRNQEVAVMSGKVTQQKIVVDNLKSEIQTLQNQIVNLQEAISIRNFSQELLDELDPYIIERKIEDARYIDERELYQFGVDKFAELRAPKVVIETSINGFLNAVEEQYYWDKLVIGDKMRVRQERMGIDYLATMIEMEVDLDSSDVDVKVANHTEELNDMDKFISILYSSQSSSTIVNNNKYKWDSILDVQDEVTQLRDSEIDATQKRITAGVNESVEIGERGIIITTPSFPEEMIIMQAGVIALSEDGGQNWKTSIRPQGVVAETIIGKLIAGNNLIITNSSGSFVMDNNGLEIDADSIKIMSGGENPKNIIDEWNNMIIDMGNFADDGTLTPYEKSQISHQWNMIQDSHSRMIISYMDNMGAETEENPYPQEYDDYIRTYESLKTYLFQTAQQDGYAILHPNRMSQTSPVDIVQYRNIVQQYMTAKDNFTLVVPMDYANAYMEVLRESISLNYVKNDEIMARLNLSEEGVRIDGKLLSINSRTEFNDDLVMNAGNIRSKDGGIRIDLNAGTIDLARTLTINAVPVATKEDIDNIQFTYSATLSNDIASIPTDEDGKNGDYFTAVTTMTIYQGATDDTPNWTFSIEKSNGIYGTLVGSTYTVTRLDDSVDSGYVDIIGRKGEEKIKKRFSISKNKQGYAGYQGKDAKILRLNANGYVLTYNNDNTPNPATQSITLDAVLENMTGTVNWTAIPYVGATAQAPIILSGSGNSRVINQGIFTGNVDSIKIKAELDGRSDTITITKLKHGQKGDTGDSAKLLYLSATAETMTFNADNTPNPANQVITLTANLQNASGNAVFTAIPYNDTTALSAITLGGSGNTRTLTQAQFPVTATRIQITATLGGLSDTISVVKLKNGATGSTGADGKNAIVGYLTNENVTFPASSAGVIAPASLTMANGIFKVFDGLTEKTGSGVTYSILSQTGTTGAITTTGAYSISAMTAENASITLRAVYAGVTIDKVLTLSKSKEGLKGDTGDSAKLLYLSATAEAMIFNADNTPNPTNQLITFTANLQNTTGIATFTATPYSGATALANITLGGSGNIRTLGHAQFPQNADRVEVKAILNNLTDTITIVKLKNGATGSDGKDAIVGYLTNESVTIPSNSEGVVTSADLTKANGTFRVFEGLVERTTETAVVFSRIGQTGATATINANGTYSISALSTDSATVVFRASYKGLNIDKTLTIAKSRAGKKGETGESGRTYWLTLSDSVIAKNPQGGYTPSKVKFSSFSKIGDGLPEAYSGRFIVQTSSDGETFVDAYKSTINESSYEFTLPNDIKSIRVKLYQAGGTVSLLDEQSIPVLVDIDSGILEGATLADKTTLLSGTEIFTDKADDDGVVHVEIDGKSVGGGSGKNLALESNKGWVSTGYNILTGYMSEDWIAGTTYTVTAKGDVNSGQNIGIWQDLGIRHLGYLNYNSTTGLYSGTFVASSHSNPSVTNRFSLYNVPSTTATQARIDWVQIEKGDSFTGYEPPAPTPEYPIEIKSLNDFDVVSSVGRKNILKNSSFRENSTGWVTSQSQKFVKDGFNCHRIDGALSTTKTANQSIVGELEVGKRYRFGGWVYTENIVRGSTNPTIMWYIDGYQPDGSWQTLGNMSFPINNNKWTYVSQITPPITEKNVRGSTMTFFVYTRDITGTVYFRDVKMEEYIDGDPENTVWTPHPEEISESENHPLIDKTNILLSEPLRSVGDVKDRLFRDSDGLWKIDRRVGEYRFSGNESVNHVATRANTYLFYVMQKLSPNPPVSSKDITNLLSNRFVGKHVYSLDEEGVYQNNEGFLRFSIAKTSVDRYSGSTPTNRFAEYLKNNETIVAYGAIPAFEILPQADQDKLNNIASYKGSNYLYTIVDKTNILPNYVRENLNPNLRATFKSSGWYYRFRTTTELNKSIKETKNQYYLSTSSTSLVGGAWLDIAPVWENEKYMWQRTLVTRTDGTTYYTPSANGTNISGAKGDSSIVGYLTNESITFATDNVGNILPTDMSKATGTFKVFEGLTEKTTDASCQFFKVSESGATANVTSNGVYTISSMTQDNATITFRAVYRGVTIDKVLNLSKAKRGDNGTSPIVGLLTNESITLPASDLGAVSSFSSATGTFNVYEGTVLRNASTSTTYSVVSQSGITVSITQSGVYTVSAMTTGASVLSGTATLRAVYGGVTIDKILTITKALAGSQGATGATGSTGATGQAGQSATSYWINASVNAIKKDVAGNIVPSTITFSGFSKTGTANPVAYSGRYIVQTSTDGTSYTTGYTSGSNQSSYTYTIPADAKFVKARLYLAGGTSVLLDEQTVPVLVDAEGLSIGGRNLAPYSTVGEYRGGGNYDTLEGKVHIEGSRISVKSPVNDLIAFTIADVSPYKELNVSFYSDLESPTMYFKFDNATQSNNGFVKKDNFFTTTLTVPTGAKNLVIGVGVYPLPTIFKPYYIDRVMVEKGNVATDWIEALEDTDAKIDEKADQGNLDAVIGDVDAIKEDLENKVDISTYAEQNNAYEEWLTTVETNANNALTTSTQIEETQLLIHNNLLDQAQRWTTLEGFVQIDSPTNSFSIKSNNSGTQMILTDDALNFISGGEVVASITNQYLKIERGIFTSSAQIGRHKFEPLATNPDHFILSYVEEGS